MDSLFKDLRRTYKCLDKFNADITKIVMENNKNNISYDEIKINNDTGVGLCKLDQYNPAIVELKEKLKEIVIHRSKSINKEQCMELIYAIVVKPVFHVLKEQKLSVNTLTDINRILLTDSKEKQENQLTNRFLKQLSLKKGKITTSDIIENLSITLTEKKDANVLEMLDELILICLNNTLC